MPLCSFMISPMASPRKLAEIWRWALMRDDPKGDVFPNPNPGIDHLHS